MNLKLLATATSILTSVLIVYFFFIIMKPNTNEKVIPTYLKKGTRDMERANETNDIYNNNNNNNNNNRKCDCDCEEDESNCECEYVNNINRELLENIKPLDHNNEHFVAANEGELTNYKDLENPSAEKDVYTNDAPLFKTDNNFNKKPKLLDINSDHRRINIY